MKKTNDRMELTIMTSEIKKGDLLKQGNGHYYIAQSDAYRHQGIWSYDIDQGAHEYRYGFSPEDTPIKVWR